MKIFRVVILSAFITLTFPYYSVFAETNNIEEVQKDVILTLIVGNLNDAIVGHYGEYRNFHLFSVEILDFEQIKEGEFNFKIKVRVPTWEEPTNKQSLDTITLEISPFRSIVTDFTSKKM
ncbi:DUF3888 domain-containing protein [Mesobacillus foraminis]|uniref:DUF3888 domain-containing protein n=1 Tax=Mesobacillus foraminis TaxID=279826 RepID=UPI0013CF1E58|nr:DUF3888 domain-containing protein [Mesobacillus foraminis]